jgi:hypothetical protein
MSGEASADMRITDEFDRLFGRFGFVLAPELVASRRRWRLRAGSSKIDVVFGREGQREYLEFYGVSKFGSDARGRIYDDGAVERLESPQDMVIFDPEIPGDLADAEAAQRAHNDQVAVAVANAGFRFGADDSVFCEAIAHAAELVDDEWEAITRARYPEGMFRSCLRGALEHMLGPIVEQEKKLSFGRAWPDMPEVRRRLGAVDLLVRYMPGGEYWRFVAELKWCKGKHRPADCKVYEVLWDALKMSAAKGVLYVEGAYLVTAAPASDWDGSRPGTELFDDGDWEVAALLGEYPSHWKHLVKLSGPPPRKLPAHFRTRLLAEQPVRDFVIKLVSIEPSFGDSVRFVDGYVERAHDRPAMTDAR